MSFDFRNGILLTESYQPQFSFQCDIMFFDFRDGILLTKSCQPYFSFQYDIMYFEVLVQLTHKQSHFLSWINPFQS